MWICDVNRYKKRKTGMNAPYESDDKKKIGFYVCRVCLWEKERNGERERGDVNDKMWNKHMQNESIEHTNTIDITNFNLFFPQAHIIICV